MAMAKQQAQARYGVTLLIAIDFLDHGRRYRKWSFPHWHAASFSRSNRQESFPVRRKTGKGSQAYKKATTNSF
jgi:hypothetical protein